jgi:hypothetical protein
MSSKKRQLRSTNTTGYTGVYKIGERFRAQIGVDGGKQKYLGTYDTPKEAALAYDRAVVQHKLPSSRLNYPDGLPIDDEDYDEIMNPKKKRRLRSTNTTGYHGVCKVGKRFRAMIRIDGKKKYLGMYDTPKEAALAYDRAVVQHKLSSSKLNFPNDYTTSSEDEESSEEESDGSSSSSDSCHSSDDDDESDDDDAPEHPPSPEAQAQPKFVREPMLDQLFADAQNQKQEQQHQEDQQQQEQQQVEEEEDSGCDSDSLWL